MIPQSTSNATQRTIHLLKNPKNFKPQHFQNFDFLEPGRGPGFSTVSGGEVNSKQIEKLTRPNKTVSIMPN